MLGWMRQRRPTKWSMSIWATCAVMAGRRNLTRRSGIRNDTGRSPDQSMLSLRVIADGHARHTAEQQSRQEAEELGEVHRSRRCPAREHLSQPLASRFVHGTLLRDDYIVECKSAAETNCHSTFSRISRSQAY